MFRFLWCVTVNLQFILWNAQNIHERLLLLASLPNNLGIYATEKHEQPFLLFSLFVACRPDSNGANRFKYSLSLSCKFVCLKAQKLGKSFLCRSSKKWLALWIRGSRHQYVRCWFGTARGVSTFLFCRILSVAWLNTDSNAAHRSSRQMCPTVCGSQSWTEQVRLSLESLHDNRNLNHCWGISGITCTSLSLKPLSSWAVANLLRCSEKNEAHRFPGEFVNCVEARLVYADHLRFQRRWIWIHRQLHQESDPTPP